MNDKLLKIISERIAFHKKKEIYFSYYLHGKFDLSASEALELSYQHAVIRTELEDILKMNKEQ